MATHTDPNQVRLTGENQYMRLHTEENGPMTTRASHWRILLSPTGPGHVLFLRSDVTEDEAASIRTTLPSPAGSSRKSLARVSSPIKRFQSSMPSSPGSGDTRAFWTEIVETPDEDIALTWYDFGEPFVISVPVGSVPERPLGWTSVFVPARRVQLTLNGRAAIGRPFPEPRGDRMSSTAGLALSETWLRPS